MATTGTRTDEVASSIRATLSLLRLHLRETPDVYGLTLSESSVLVRLEHHGPLTAAKLAKMERISPQSIGATVAVLEERELITRAADPTDGRRMILSITDAGLEMVQHRRALRAAHLAQVLSEHFTEQELELLHTAAPLLERLGQLS